MNLKINNMKLIHFFRLIQMSIFQKSVTDMMYNKCYDNKMTYDNTRFFVLILFVMTGLV